MASQSPHTIETPEPPDFAGAKFVEYEEFIESQLRKTRSHVRGVDIAAGILVLLAGTLAFFFLAAMIDHWLITGGLGFWGRLILLVGYLAVAGWWTATQILPLLLKRINPLYAAQTIERSRPSLKNSLVNFLLFRSDPAGVHRRVFEAIEEQAATDLVGVPIESAVDRTRLVRLGYLLVGIVAVCAVYALVSPKNLFQTVGRVVMPWADISPPTRTTIDEIEPGSAQAFRGQQVTVKARVEGLPDEGRVILYYTTADRQIVDRPVEMNRPPGDYRHAAVLPAGESALQQSLTYRIEAGDARTPNFAIDVVAAPTIVVRAVEYKYPEYTGLLARRVEHDGDLKAIEGTQVTLEALANQDIASAYVDFDSDDTLDLPLRGEGTAAKASFRLALSEDRQRAEHSSYQLVFKNAAGQRNPQPVKHQIEVTRDVSPEIQFVAPSREEIELPLDAVVDLEIVAIDPDFALASVKLSAFKGNEPVVDEKLLDETWRGQYAKKYRFHPGKLKLAAGDTVEYFATAVDNKSPRPNQTETARRRIRIVAPTGRAQDDQFAQNDPAAGQRDEGEPQPGQGPEGDHPRDAQPDDQTKAEPGEPGEERSPENAGQSEDSGENARPQDKSQDQQGSESKGSESKGSESGAQEGQKGNQGEHGQQSGERQSGDAQPGEEQAGEPQQGEAGEGQSGDGKSGKPSGSQQSGGDDAAGAQAGGENAGGEQASGEQAGSEQGGSEPSVPSDGTNDGDAFERILKHREEQGKQDPAGDQPAGQQKESGESGDAQQPSGEESAGDKSSPGSKQREQQPGDRQNGKQSGEKSGSEDGADPKSGEKGDKPQPGQGQQQPGDSDAKSPPQGGEKSPADDKSQPGSPQPGDKSQQGEKQSAQPGEDAAASEQKGSAESSDPAGQEAGKQQSPSEQSGADAQDKRQSGEQKPGQDREPAQSDPQGATQDNNPGEEGTPQKPDTQGQGAQAKDDPMRGGEQPQKSGEQRPDAKGGDGDQQKGESGAGQKSNEDQGSPHAQDSNQPRDKSQQPGQQQQESPKDSQEQSPSNSKRESDSESSEDGDRSGGGKRGGGQKSNQPGTGGAGQNTAADEGAGQSDESGDGETSDRAGDDKQADGKTGQSGAEQGKGSQQQPGTGENQQPGGEQSPADEQGEPSTEASGDSASPGGGAQGGDRQSGQPPGPGTAPEEAWQPGTDAAEKANLDYSRQATDLALEHLRHELGKDQPDQALLDRLGWTREQAEAFVNRWETMRKNAQAPERRDSSGRQLDDALRSLGLRPRGTALGANTKRDDRTQGYQESHRTTPPPEYSEAFKAYTQGTSRGGK